MSNNEHGQPNSEGSSTRTQMVYRDHEISYRDDEEGFELSIDGREFGHMAGRLGPGRYYSHLLPFVEYSTPEALAEALADRKGEVWIDDESQRDREYEDTGPHEHEIVPERPTSGLEE